MTKGRIGVLRRVVIRREQGVLDISHRAVELAHRIGDGLPQGSLRCDQGMLRHEPGRDSREDQPRPRRPLGLEPLDVDLLPLAALAKIAFDFIERFDEREDLEQVPLFPWSTYNSWNLRRICAQQPTWSTPSRSPRAV